MAAISTKVMSGFASIALMIAVMLLNAARALVAALLLALPRLARPPFLHKRTALDGETRNRRPPKGNPITIQFAQILL
jgi:hypothetical protein